MNSLRRILFFILFYIPLTMAVQSVFCQSISLQGLVVDAQTNEPIPLINVFIANTTRGTLSDEKGEFTLDKIPSSGAEVVFMAMNYEKQSLWVEDEGLAIYYTRIKMVPKVFGIEPVVVVGKRDPVRRYYESSFLQYFLGDVSQSVCILRNPEDVEYTKQGLVIIATGRQPLIIDNYRLGYRLIYHLDYFIYRHNPYIDKNYLHHYKPQKEFYAFQGKAFFEEMKANSEDQLKRWLKNREKYHKGSFSDFLSQLYYNKLKANDYTVVLAGNKGIIDSNKKAVVSTFYYDYTRREQKYLSWDITSDYPLYQHTRQVDNMNRCLQISDTLLVFKDFNGTDWLGDDEKSMLFIGNGELVYNKLGQYQMYNGDLIWGSLNSGQQIINLLPFDFIE